MRLAIARARHRALALARVLAHARARKHAADCARLSTSRDAQVSLRGDIGEQ
jgi:hypothetical protein